MVVDAWTRPRGMFMRRLDAGAAFVVRETAYFSLVKSWRIIFVTEHLVREISHDVEVVRWLAGEKKWVNEAFISAMV